MPHGVSPKRFHETDWRIIREAACAHFRTESLEAGADLVESIVGLADAADRPLEVDLRAGGVTVRIRRTAESSSSPISRSRERSHRRRRSWAPPWTRALCRRSRSRSTRW